MVARIVLLLLVSALCLVQTGCAAISGDRAASEEKASGPVPVTPNASPEAKALLKFLHSVSGKQTLSGQHNYPNTTNVYTERASEVLGKVPAIFGQDFGFAAPGDKDAVAARPQIIEELKRQYAKGSLVTLCWHAVRPTDDEPVTFRGSVQGKLTDQQWDELITPGTELYKRWCAQVDVIAGFLKQLQDARVPVLWRPYHEMNGDWFWWGGRRGERGTTVIYRQLFDRLVNFHKLNNLIWIWSVDRPTTRERQFVDYCPGTNHFDIAALDVYRGDFQQSYYEDLLKAAGGKPVTLAEVGPAPTLEVIEQQPKWSWWMTWAGMIGGRFGTNTNALRMLVDAPCSWSLSDAAYVEAITPLRAASGLPPAEPVIPKTIQ
jgi:mannan endo-1,4-beta-mannosidase